MLPKYFDVASSKSSESGYGSAVMGHKRPEGVPPSNAAMLGNNSSLTSGSNRLRSRVQQKQQMHTDSGSGSIAASGYGLITLKDNRQQNPISKVMLLSQYDISHMKR